MLTVVGSAALLLALFVRRRGLWLYALGTLSLSGLSVYPVYFAGDEAADSLRNTWYIVRSAVDEHDQAAGFALGCLLLLGAVSAYAWWRMLRREMTGLPPVWLRTVLTVLALFGVTIVGRTAYLGGKIVHDSPILLGPAPAGLPPSTR